MSIQHIRNDFELVTRGHLTNQGVHCIVLRGHSGHGEVGKVLLYGDLPLVGDLGHGANIAFFFFLFLQKQQLNKYQFPVKEMRQ